MTGVEATWLNTDEADDVAGSIRHALRSAGFVAEDPQAWKWVALALHSALQGACICHLVTTAPPLGAVTQRNAAEWLAYHAGAPHQSQHQTTANLAHGTARSSQSCGKAHSAGDRSNEVGIAISNAELNWLRRLHEAVRNQFVHFEPMVWSLEVSGIPDVAVLIARVVAEIADVGWAFPPQGRRPEELIPLRSGTPGRVQLLMSALGGKRTFVFAVHHQDATFSGSQSKSATIAA